MATAQYDDELDPEQAHFFGLLAGRGFDGKWVCLGAANDHMGAQRNHSEGPHQSALLKWVISDIELAYLRNQISTYLVDSLRVALDLGYQQWLYLGSDSQLHPLGVYNRHHLAKEALPEDSVWLVSHDDLMRWADQIDEALEAIQPPDRPLREKP